MHTQFFICYLCSMVSKKKRLGHWFGPVTRLAIVACMCELLTHACNSSRVINLPKEGKLKNLPGKAEGDGCFNGGLLDVTVRKSCWGWCNCGVKAKTM